MTRVRYLAPGVPEPGDPLGARPDADPTPTWLDAEVLVDNGDGTFRVRIGKDGPVIMDATEGEGVRQFRTVSRVRLDELVQIRADFQALLSDSDASVRTAARAVRAFLTGADARQVAADLRTAALNTGLAAATRTQAITLLGLLIAEERDR